MCCAPSTRQPSFVKPPIHNASAGYSMLRLDTSFQGYIVQSIDS